MIRHESPSNDRHDSVDELGKSPISQLGDASLLPESGIVAHDPFTAYQRKIIASPTMPILAHLGAGQSAVSRGRNRGGGHQ